MLCLVVVEGRQRRRHNYRRSGIPAAGYIPSTALKYGFTEVFFFQWEFIFVRHIKERDVTKKCVIFVRHYVRDVGYTGRS